MPENIGRAHCQALIKRIRVITGWPIPELPEDRELLYRELYLHFCEDWPTFNPEEMAYAIRSFGTEINNWGKEINLSLIDQCFAAYYNSERREASDWERQQAERVPESHRIAPAADWRPEIESQYQKFLAGKTRMEFLPAALLDALEKLGAIPAGIWEKMVPAALKWLESDFRRRETDILAGKGNDKRSELKAEFDALKSQMGQYHAVAPTAKKLTVLKYFAECRDGGIKSFYVKNESDGENL